MKIYTLNRNDSELCDFIKEYEKLVDNKIIFPDYIKTDILTELKDNEQIIFARQNNDISGLLIYRTWNPKNRQNFEKEFAKKIFPWEISEGYLLDGQKSVATIQFDKAKGLNEYTFKQDLIMLRYLESFPQRIGTGKILMQELKKLNCEGIFFEISDDAYGFYKKQNFVETGYYIYNKKKPIIVWMKSGQYKYNSKIKNI